MGVASMYSSSLKAHNIMCFFVYVVLTLIDVLTIVNHVSADSRILIDFPFRLLPSLYTTLAILSDNVYDFD